MGFTSNAATKMGYVGDKMGYVVKAMMPTHGIIPTKNRVNARRHNSPGGKHADNSPSPAATAEAAAAAAAAAAPASPTLLRAATLGVIADDRIEAHKTLCLPGDDKGINTQTDLSQLEFNEFQVQFEKRHPPASQPPSVPTKGIETDASMWQQEAGVVSGAPKRDEKWIQDLKPVREETVTTDAGAVPATRGNSFDSAENLAVACRHAEMGMSALPKSAAEAVDLASVPAVPATAVSVELQEAVAEMRQLDGITEISNKAASPDRKVEEAFGAVVRDDKAVISQQQPDPEPEVGLFCVTAVLPANGCESECCHSAKAGTTSTGLMPYYMCCPAMRAASIDEDCFFPGGAEASN